MRCAMRFCVLRTDFSVSSARKYDCWFKFVLFEKIVRYPQRRKLSNGEIAPLYGSRIHKDMQSLKTTQAARSRSLAVE